MVYHFLKYILCIKLSIVTASFNLQLWNSHLMFDNAKDVETYLGVLDAVFMISYAAVSTSSELPIRSQGSRYRAPDMVHIFISKMPIS